MLAATLLWSTAGVVTRWLERAEGFELTFWRSLFAALSMAAILVVIHGRNALAVVRGIALSRALLRLRHRDLRALLADVWPARNCVPGADRCQSTADGR